MTSREFIYQVIKLYRSAQKSKFGNKKIKRGRSHSISSSAEDLFAYFLSRRIKCDHIYIDQPINIKGLKTQLYPDLVVVRNKRIVAFCDLKMDLGWRRAGLYDLCKKQYNRLKRIRGKECTLLEGINKTKHIYTINRRTTYNIVIFSDQNINSNLLSRQIKKSFIFNPNVEIFVLTAKEHPNTYGIKIKDLMRKIEIKDNVFKKLIQKLK